MAKASFISLLCMFLFLSYLFNDVKCDAPFAPALYVFGDSVVDSGNNNYLQTLIKVNYKPYGIDFPFGATGRFTNGKTVADYVAQSLGLPFAPPYLGLSSHVDKRRIITGVNYASGSAGILPESGTALGKNLDFGTQIKYFQDTVTKNLPKFFKSHLELSHYLSKSIFFIVIGNNDYLNNYIQPARYNSSKIYTPQHFGQLLLGLLKTHLKKLYTLGARKFVVADVAPVGCLPAVVNSIKPKPTTPCAENLNGLVTFFNAGLPKILLELQKTLPGSKFVQGEVYKILYDMNQNPSKYGLLDAMAPCCVSSKTIGLCFGNREPCQNRSTHLYWDLVHPSQQAYSLIAKSAFSTGSFLANIKLTAEKP